MPFDPEKSADKYKYKNYKGWLSIAVLAYVNSFHLFAGFKVGDVGKTPDTRAMKTCKFLQRMKDDATVREAWLGEDGVIAGDGGTSDNTGILLIPIFRATELPDIWYNFCHSSTRFFVEEGACACVCGQCECEQDFACAPKRVRVQVQQARRRACVCVRWNERVCSEIHCLVLCASVFGRWKNRFRILLRPMKVSHRLASSIIAGG